MKLPWQKKDATGAESSRDSADTAETASTAKSSAPEGDERKLPKGYTPPKGRPTPKRMEQEVAKGVRRDPHSMSSGQAYKRRKELKKSMSKQEWKDYKAQERAERRERNRKVQERMAAGDERYLLARDKGEVRAYVRDWVDSRRYFNEWAMPAALVLLLVMFVGTILPSVTPISTALAMVFIIVLLVEGIWLARRCNNAVRVKFPGTTEAGVSLGFYAYGRATQPFKWRTPRPRVEHGSKID